jgi:hypothetical protein
MSTVTSEARGTQSTTAPPHEQLLTLINLGVASRVVQVVADLGIADHVGDYPVTAEALANVCGVNPGALDRVLRLLTDCGVFAYEGNGYRHNEASRLLRSDHPQSLRAFAQMQGLPVFYNTYGHLSHSIRTGAPAFQLVDARGMFPYLTEHPDEARVFDQAMTAKANGDTAAILATCDFQSAETIADIGGGRGHLLRAVLDAAPRAHGILFDLPDVVAALPPAGPRFSSQAGDFFVDPLPAADTYLLMEIIHDWADAEATAILRAVRRAAKPGARVLIIETIPDGDRPDPRGRTLDVIMLAVTGGRERTGSELGVLLRNAGFSEARIIDTGGPLRIAEATA